MIFQGRIGPFTGKHLVTHAVLGSNHFYVRGRSRGGGGGGGYTDVSFTCV